MVGSVGDGLSGRSLQSSKSLGRPEQWLFQVALLFHAFNCTNW